MTAALRGEWRVVGRSTDGHELLLRPLDGQTVPDDAGPAGCVRVGTDGYGGDLGVAVDDLRPGDRVRATLYPGRSGRPGRLVDVDVRERVRLTSGRVRRVPDLAVDLWERAVAASDDGPVAASQALDTPEGHAELHVAQRTVRTDGDNWVAFRFGDGLEARLTAFEHAPGAPAEVVALDPVDRPFFLVMAFERADGDTAATLRERAFAAVDPEEVRALVDRTFADTGRSVRVG